MACVNPKNLIYLITYDATHPRKLIINPNVAVTMKHDKEKYDFFYIQFSDPKSFKFFPITELIDEQNLKDIKEGKTYLVLDNGLEYFYSCANAIYSDVVAKGIPAEQIIFLSNTPTMIDHVKLLASRLGKPEIKVEWFSLFEITGKNTIMQRKDFPTLEKKKKYSKKFLNLNRRWRMHRPLLYTLMKDRNLIQYGHISLSKSDDGVDWKDVYPKMLSMYKDHKVGEIIKRNPDVVDTPDLILDIEDLVTNRADHETSIQEFYRDTYFSVVNETTYHEGVPFLSEKIFKTIAMGHPFVLVTAPESLQYLKKLGYKTFHPYINETYDSILDHGDRLLAIVDEIERLCKMDKVEFKNWRASILPIVKHNYTMLNNKQKISRPMNF